MTTEEIIEIAKRLYGGNITTEDLRKHKTIEFARLIEQATLEENAALRQQLDFEKREHIEMQKYILQLECAVTTLRQRVAELEQDPQT